MSQPVTLQLDLNVDTVTSLMHTAELDAKRYGLMLVKDYKANLGPFTVDLSGTGSLREDTGSFVLSSPNHFGIHDCVLDFTLSTDFAFDINPFLPSGFPHIPTLNVPVSYSDAVTLSGDFALNVQSDASSWTVKLIIIDALNVPIQAAGVFLDHLRQEVTSAVHATLGFFSSIPGIGTIIDDVINAVLGLIHVDKVQDALTNFFGEMINGFPLRQIPRTYTLSKVMTETVNVPGLLSATIPVDLEVDVEIVALSSSVSADNHILTLAGAATVNLKSQSLSLTLSVTGAEEVSAVVP
jgi:hypothetical protein